MAYESGKIFPFGSKKELGRLSHELLVDPSFFMVELGILKYKDDCYREKCCLLRQILKMKVNSESFLIKLLALYL